MRTFLRRLKGAAVNALVWGFAWFWLGVGISLMLQLAGGPTQGAVSLLFQTLMAGAFSGIFGAVIGGGFSLFIAANFRHQRVEDLSAWRFSLGGALVAVASILLARYLSDSEGLVDQALLDPFSLYSSLTMQMLVAGAIGGLTAFGTIKLAQNGTGLERLGAGDGRIPLEAGGTETGG